MPFVTGKRRTRIMVISISILLILGVIDYITGYEIGFFIFYFIPVSIAAWYGGRKPGIAMACASAVCWYLADRMTHHPYPRPYLIYWETFARYISFLTTALTLSKIRETIDNGQRVREELDRALEENRELKRLLQGGVGSGGIQERHNPGADPP
jgi:K+-sensing histidine kinase KdpD